ncbi:PREDICTED: crossover junction endonuclease EME1 [Vollenhovia emeryi]|uniref:crossover junction endonuclease EME1 n=1 Tax=Vollenhovia emeryi TaxID=411798 RepID=UPI0005F544D6|nr:PREDICTED: crossover junction endonuclease EME1 [Vollenhovia emeryi]
MPNVIVLSDSDEPASPVADERDGVGPELGDRYRSGARTSDLDLPEVPFCREIAASASPADDGRGLLAAEESSSDSGDNRVVAAASRKAAAAPGRDRATLEAERARRRHALAREKALKAIERRAARDTKPGECLKFMEVVLDRGIDAESLRGEIESALRSAGVKFDVTAESIPGSVTWRRSVEEEYVGEDNEVRARRSVRTEEHAIVIWSSREAVGHVADGTFGTSVSSIRDLIPGYSLTLLVCGMDEYFARRMKQRDRNPADKGPRCNGRADERFDAWPTVSRRQLEMCLAEIQIASGCSGRLIESAQDLALTVCQYTKSVSEIPHKLRKRENLEGKFSWYVTGDNRNTVRVDRDGNGLRRLWQQQLCQFNLSSLETAEAICAVYPSPVRLVEAYRNCTPDEGMNLLKDIPIRRAAGPLTTTRKIGPELSKKVYVMFTSQNGDALLGSQA